MAGQHTLVRQTWIPAAPEAVFSFFSDAANLEAVTPPWMHFRILTPAPIRMAAGTRIEYQLRWRVFPLKWTTAIEIWDPPRRFDDVQLSGPYRYWHHTHEFAPDSGGTLMTDSVRYALPFGVIGRWVERLMIRRELEQLFDYRAERIREIFAGMADGSR